MLAPVDSPGVSAVHDNAFNGRTAKRRAVSTLDKAVAAVSTQSASNVARSTSTHWRIRPN
jgi:hypothetical protein